MPTSQPHDASAPAPTPRTDAPADAATVIAASSPSATPAQPAPMGEVHRLGPYTLTRLIAYGGMGAVWEAIDGRLGRRVAVKVMLQGDSRPEAIERFHREALHAAKLRHENIVAVLDVGHDRGRRYIVMDLIEGPTLDAALRERPLTWREKAELVEAIARAVQYAHEQGVVHRDLKPANILLRRSTSSTRAWRKSPTSTARVPRRGSSPSGAHDAAPPIGDPLVMDFGLAMDVAQDSRLSRDGQAMGTPSYMPPEQAEGRLDEIGPRSDVYGLGAILYEALTGRPPFTGETPARIIRAVVEDEPPPPGRIVDGVPRDLETICLTCLAKQPAKRYASAAALADDLAAWLAGDPIAARRASAVERLAKRVRKNPAAWLAASGAVLASVLGIAGTMAVLVQSRGEAVKHATQLDGLIADMRAEQAKREAAEADRLRLQREKDREWQLVFEDRFDRDDLAERWDIVNRGGSTEVVDGHLHLRDGNPEVAMPRGRYNGDLRLEFTCRQRGPLLCDISAFLTAPPEASHWTGGSDSYLFQYGGRANTETRLLRDNETVVEAHPPPIEADRTYRVRAERVGGRLTYAIDGRVILDYVDPHPIPDGERPRVGIYCWAADAWIDDVRIYRLGEPRSADVLDLVERRLQRGETLDARALVDEVIESTSDPERAARAQRARDAIERVRRRDEDVARVRAAVAAAWPGAKVSSTDEGASVDLSERPVDDLTPLAGLPIARLSCRLTHVASLEPLRGMPLVDLELTGTPVRSLAPLAGMRLRTLTISGTDVADLSPLAGMPLEELFLVNTAVSDLSPLAGMPLRTLMAQRTRVSDLSPLAGMPLASLDCSEDPVRSLAPLAGMPLRMLGIAGLGLADLEAVRGQPLSSLDCGRNRIASLAPLAGMPLSSLDASDNPIEDLSPLAALPLVFLDVDGTRVSSLGPMHALPLVSLSAADTPVTDLSALAGLHLGALDVSRDRVADLSPLVGQRLQDVRIAGTPIRDLSPLAGAPLERLDCTGCPVASLDGLDLAHLVVLQCRGCAIADLSPLRGDAALRRLWCGGSQVASFAPIAGLPLDELEAIGVPARDAEALAAAPPALLLLDPGLTCEPLARAWSRRYAGLVDGANGTIRPLSSLDPGPLRARATAHGGRRYAALPSLWYWSEAELACRALGGRLAVFTDVADANAVLGWIDGSIWVGLRAHDGSLRWLDGSPGPAEVAAAMHGASDAVGAFRHATGFASELYPVVGHDAYVRVLGAAIEWDD